MEPFKSPEEFHDHALKNGLVVQKRSKKIYKLVVLDLTWPTFQLHSTTSDWKSFAIFRADYRNYFKHLPEPKPIRWI